MNKSYESEQAKAQMNIFATQLSLENQIRYWKELAEYAEYMQQQCQEDLDSTWDASSTDE